MLGPLAAFPLQHRAPYNGDLPGGVNGQIGASALRAVELDNDVVPDGQVLAWVNDIFSMMSSLAAGAQSLAPDVIDILC